MWQIKVPTKAWRSHVESLFLTFSHQDYFGEKINELGKYFGLSETHRAILTGILACQRVENPIPCLVPSCLQIIPDSIVKYCMPTQGLPTAPKSTCQMSQGNSKPFLFVSCFKILMAYHVITLLLISTYLIYIFYKYINCRYNL